MDEWQKIFSIPTSLSNSLATRLTSAAKGGATFDHKTHHLSSLGVGTLMGATVSHRPPPSKTVNVRRPAKPSTDDSYDAETDMVVSSLPSTIASAPTSLHLMPPSKPSTVHGPSRPFAVQLTIEGQAPLPGQYYLLAKLIPPKVDTKLNEWEDWKCNPPRAHWDLIFGVNRYALDGSPMGGGSTPGELLFLNKPATPHILSFYVATDDNKLNTDRINIAVFTIR